MKQNRMEETYLFELVLLAVVMYTQAFKIETVFLPLLLRTLSTRSGRYVGSKGGEGATFLKIMRVILNPTQRQYEQYIPYS